VAGEEVRLPKWQTTEYWDEYKRKYRERLRSACKCMTSTGRWRFLLNIKRQKEVGYENLMKKVLTLRAEIEVLDEMLKYIDGGE